MKKIPIWEKSNLNSEEAAAYSEIGINKLLLILESASTSCCLFWNWHQQAAAYSGIGINKLLLILESASTSCCLFWNRHQQAA